jgi:crotonobetainyl-CoA:carnitine CoA-transferase CaiB-like acyl-CoA transferase
MYVSGTQSGPPVKLCGPQPYYTASLFGAVAVLIHLRKRNISGKGSYFDLSIQEAVASTLGHVMIDYFHSGRISRRGENDKSEGFSILPAKDGYIQITILRNWDTLLELIDSEGLAGDLLDNKWLDASYREEHFDHIASIVAEWTRRHTKRELFELGQTMRFPWASIDTIDEVLTSPQLKFRKFFNQRPFSGEGPEITFPGPPYKFSSLSPLSQKPAPFPAKDASDILDALLSEREKKETEPEIRNRCADEKILQGLRVLDLTRMLSGPYATRILADYGAEVIKVQSGKTAQGAEQNETAYFSAWNRNKRSITLDLNAPEAKDAFLKLAAGSDVIIENFSPRVMENWELGYERLREVNPELVMISISAMGRTGPWRDFVGFAPTFHALSGLISETSENLNPPADLGHAYGDVIAGLYAALATLAAIEYRQKTGKGRHVDLSVYEAMCTLLGPAFIEKQLNSRFEIRDSRLKKNHQFDSQSRISNLESRIYKCAGLDRWCVISLETEEQRQTLCGIAGLGELTDDLIRRWTALQTPESIVLQLQNAGIAAGVVQNAEDLARDPQLAARRFFVSLKHPTLGKVISDRSALWDWRHRPKDWKPSPLLGQDNHKYLEALSL